MLEPMFQWLKFLHLWWIYLEIGRDPKNVNKLNLHTYWAIGPRPVLLKNLLELHTLIWALDWLAQSQEPVWKPPGNHAASDNTQMGEIWQIINWVVDSLKKKKPFSIPWLFPANKSFSAWPASLENRLLSYREKTFNRLFNGMWLESWLFHYWRHSLSNPAITS